MKLGLALSGGGYRATVFHLGVLARLAKDNLLEDVTFISTVSGGTLSIGLVFAANGYLWPSSSVFLSQVLPHARKLLTTTSLHRSLIWRQLLSLWSIFDTRADDVSALLRSEWGVTAKLSALPKVPRWMINTTCAETGKDWRFERFQMGDFIFGYSHDTDQVPLSDAMAASAGFPGAIGPLVLDTTRLKWFRYKKAGPAMPDQPGEAQPAASKTEPVTPTWNKVHLWDGGVYDNLGLEALGGTLKGWRKEVDFAIISDAAGHARPEAYQAGYRALIRIFLGIMFDQIRSLRTRDVLRQITIDKDPGAFVQAGNSCAYVLGQAGFSQAEIDPWQRDCLSDEAVARAEGFATDIDQLSPEDFENLLRHGFEVADYTLGGYHRDRFVHVPYSQIGAAHT